MNQSVFAFKETFDTPFDQYAERHGEPFKVLCGPYLDVPDSTGSSGMVLTYDEMVEALELCGDLPVFSIQFVDGAVIEAHPEEVLADWEWESNPNRQRPLAARQRFTYGDYAQAA